MVYRLSVMADRNEVLKKEYQDALEGMDLTALVKDFLAYLDYKEETDSGNEFHPITIGSSRVMLGEQVGMCLTEIRRRVK